LINAHLAIPSQSLTDYTASMAKNGPYAPQTSLSMANKLGKSFSMRSRLTNYKRMKKHAPEKFRGMSVFDPMRSNQR